MVNDASNRSSNEVIDTAIGGISGNEVDVAGGKSVGIKVGVRAGILPLSVGLDSCVGEEPQAESISVSITLKKIGA